MKRLLVILSCLFLVVSSLCFSVDALGVDYNELNPSVAVDGQNDIVTVSVPSRYFNIDVVTSSGTYSGTDYLKFRLDLEQSTNIIFSLFYGDRLDVTNIPDGTVFTFDFDIDCTTPYSTPVMSGAWNYYGESSYLGSEWTESNNWPVGNTQLTVVMNKPNLAQTANFRLFFDNLVPLQSSEFVIRFYSCTFTMSISSLYRLQQQTGKTNQILSEVEKHLAEQGQTLDDVLGAQQDSNNKLDNIINGAVSPSLPAGSGAVGDLDDLEGEVRDDAQQGLDEGLNIQNNAFDVFLSYATAFAAAGAVFGLFSDIPFFASLLYVSVALGIFSVLLNLAVEGGSSISRRESREKKEYKNRLRSMGRKKGS